VISNLVRLTYDDDDVCVMCVCLFVKNCRRQKRRGRNTNENGLSDPILFLFFTLAILTLVENIGFDIRGDVKVFDFGLVKSLDGRLKSKTGYGYNLTGFTGSIPYVSLSYQTRLALL
jgi:hypothetical protein